MASLSNQQYNTKSMSGLSDVYATNIVCDTIDVADEITLEPGGILTLPNNSIQDSYLSNNVAFRNQNNTFSLTNIFSNIVQFTSTTIPVITQSIAANDASTKISTTNWVDTYFGKLSGNQTWSGTNIFSNAIQFTSTTIPIITNSIPANDSTTKISTTNWIDTYFGKLSGNQTWSGTNTFSSTTGVRFNYGFIQNDINGGSNSTSMYQASANCTITNNFNNGAIRLNTRNSSGVAQDNVYALNGNRAGLQGDSGNTIEILGTQATIGGTSVPKITTQPLTASNTNEIASTSFVKNQGYITSSALTAYSLLAPTSLQTFSGTAENTFNNQVNVNAGIRFVDTFTSKISQQGNALVIENISNVNSVQIRTTTAGLVQRTGLLIENGITCTLQGGSGNTITITGLNTPTIGIPPLASVYSNEIATTQWINNELVSIYARLNPTSLQIWGTNENQFNTQVTMNIVGTRYLDTTNSSLISQTGNNLRLENISNSNSIQLRTKTSTGVVSQNLLCRNGNEIVMKGNAGILRILDSACTVECVTFSSDAVSFSTDAPITTNYNTFSAVPTKGIYDIGYNFEIAGTSFANWVGFTTTGNVVTVNFDGTGNFVRGVYQVDIVLTTEISSSPNTRLIWTQVSSTSSAITQYCTYESTGATFNTTNFQIMRLSFVLKVSTYTSTYYLNYVRTAGVGSGLVENKANSHIQFTRIA